MDEIIVNNEELGSLLGQGATITAVGASDGVAASSGDDVGEGEAVLPGG